MTKKQAIKINVERIEDLLRFKSMIDAGNLLDWTQWCSVTWNVYGGFNEDDAIKFFGKGECIATCSDEDITEEQRLNRGADALAQNEFDKWGDYTSRNDPQDHDLLEAMKDALKLAGYEKYMQ